MSYTEDDAAFDAWAERAGQSSLDEFLDAESEDQLGAPVMAAYMTYGPEVLHISAYNDPRMVVETYVGETIRDIPVGSRPYALSETFAERVLAHEQLGWRHTSPNGGVR